MTRWAVAVLATLLACRDDAGVTTIRLWAMGREGEVVAELVRDFEHDHPGVRVEVQQLPWSSAHEKLLTAFVGDATPDLAQLGNTWVPELAALGALAPLDAEVAASTGVQPADYFAGIWDTNTVDSSAPRAAGAGQARTVDGSAPPSGGAGRVLYGVPWYVDTRLLFYRRDLLAAAGVTTVPATWSTWLDAMQAIAAHVGPDRYAILLPLDEHEQLLALALQQDAPLLRDHDRWGNFRSPGFHRALAFYLGIFAHRLAPIATQIQASNPWDELGRGYVSFLIQGPWSIGEFKRRLPAEQQASWATAPLPGPDGPGASIAGGSSLVVFRASAHPREAWQLIEYLSQPAVQRRFYELTGDLPPRRTSWEDPRFRDDEYVRAFRDQLERVRRTPPVPEWERIATAMRTVTERAARRVGATTTAAELDAIVDAAATELDADVDAILEKRRWILGRRGVP